MATWNSRGLRGSTLEEFINRTNETYIEPIGSPCVVVPPDTQHFQLDVKAVEACITEHTRAILVNTPNNPSGTVYTSETIKKLSDVLRRKSAEIGHPIYLI